MATVKKIVLCVQDLRTKDKVKVAVLSGDVHYIVDDGESYDALLEKIETTKDEQQRTKLELEEKKLVKIASFQLSLDSSPELRRQIAALAEEAIVLKEEKDAEPKK